MEGGVGDYAASLGGALAALGARVHALVPSACAGTRVDGIEVHSIGHRWSSGALLRARALARRLRLDALLLQYQAGAFHLRGPIHFLPAVAGVPVVTTFHDLRVPWLFPLAGRLRRDAVTLLARSSKGVVAAEPRDLDELRRRGARLAARIPIGSNVPCAPPADWERDAFRTRMGVARDDLLVGHFGLQHPLKGARDLLLALDRLVRGGHRVRLVLIGGSVGTLGSGHEDFAAEFERDLERLGLRDRVSVTDHLPARDVSAHLLSCDVVALPYRDGASHRRGTLTAALAHGCAIVTTRPELPDPAWRDGENMRLVPVADPDALAAAVAELAQDRGLRERLSNGALASAGDFDWSTIARRTLDFVAACAGTREASPADPSEKDSARAGSAA